MKVSESIFLTKLIHWTRKNKFELVSLLSAWLFIGFLGLAWPLPESAGNSASALSDLTVEYANGTGSGNEDLSSFRESRRWGISLNEIIEIAGIADQRSVNPILQQMGYVGLIRTENRHEVLLLMPDGNTQRLTLGDNLPDGRELIAIDDNSLTLRDADENSEVLMLFPELTSDTGNMDAVEAPADVGAITN